MATIKLINILKKYSRKEAEGTPAFVSFFLSSFKSGQGKEPKVSGVTAVRNLNLTVPDGKTLVVLGPSGCGKTTLLKILAGLIRPDSGIILFNGKEMTSVPPGERGIGMVFQNYALYPHFSSRRNILSYFLFKKKTPELKKEAQAKFERTAEVLGVEIKYLMKKKPDKLSGGQQQRVALGRCITRDPSLFLLDEPFSNLDQQLRERYRVHLKQLLSQFHITTVYVTHDQQEAMILADLLAIMNEGEVVQTGSARELYEKPNNLFVAEFINFDTETPAINLIEGEKLSPLYAGKTIGVRPEDVKVSFTEKTGYLAASISGIRDFPLKNTFIMSIDFKASKLVARVPPEQKLPSASARDHVWIRFAKFHVFDKNSRQWLETCENEPPVD